MDAQWYDRRGRESLARILPRLRARCPDVPEPEWQAFALRMEEHYGRLFPILHGLYGQHYDFFFHLESILATAVSRWVERPDDLKALDAAREADPAWYQSHRMVGYVAYVDLFAGTLNGVRDRIPYFKELGITYLHLMPLFRSPAGDNDGGYAISSYRDVHPALGTMEDLTALARDLRNHGISLCLDFVFNHTSDEHEWARRALDGSVEHQEYYRMFDDRTWPDRYERTVRSIFPEEHPGAFTYRPRIRKWVWTTFKNYQWDLNYENPAVFNRMADELLFLANQGVEILRLDAVAFLWKRVDTSCENLPEAHQLIQAFNALVRIAAPSLLFKSEAIVHPDEVVKYVSTDECQLSYNPNLMALLWDALATRDVRLLRHSLRKRFALPPGTVWANYVRGHDDIGWGFSNEDMREQGVEPFDHRRFLNAFYTGRHEASFAVGVAFQEDPRTGDARVSGSAASLAGLERALTVEGDREIDLAVGRLLLLHGVLFTIGGIPLIYSGDEIATLNDYAYRDDPEKAGDARWVHRSPFDWNRADRRSDDATPAGRVYQGMLHLSQLRQNTLALTRSETEIVDTGTDHVLAYFRQSLEQGVLVLANFTERPRLIDAIRLRQLGLRRTLTDLVAGRLVIASESLMLEPYQLMMLVASRP